MNGVVRIHLVSGKVITTNHKRFVQWFENKNGIELNADILVHIDDQSNPIKLRYGAIEFIEFVGRP